MGVIRGSLQRMLFFLTVLALWACQKEPVPVEASDSDSVSTQMQAPPHRLYRCFFTRLLVGQF